MWPMCATILCVSNERAKRTFGFHPFEPATTSRPHFHSPAHSATRDSYPHFAVEDVRSIVAVLELCELGNVKMYFVDIFTMIL
jgi:hypothetical protein